MSVKCVYEQTGMIEEYFNVGGDSGLLFATDRACCAIKYSVISVIYFIVGFIAPSLAHNIL